MPVPPPIPLKAGLFGRSTGPRTIKPTATGAPRSKGPSGVKIEHRVGIQAPAEVIWSVIADVAGWPNWNPIYPKASGDIRIGAVLDLTLALPGQAHEEIRPTVLDWVPLEQLHLRLAQMGGLIRTVRYVEIEAMARRAASSPTEKSSAGCSASRGPGARVARSIAALWR